MAGPEIRLCVKEGVEATSVRIMNMSTEPKLMLVDVIDAKSSSFYPPLNLVCLASYLTKNKKLDRKNIKIINSSFDNVEKEINDFNPDIIGLSAVTPFYNLALKLAKKIRKISGAVLVLGGYHISALPEFLERPFDMGVVGEGEYSLTMIVETWKKGMMRNNESLSKIPNLVYFDNSGKIVLNKTKKVMTVDDLTEIDWQLIPRHRVVNYISLPIDGRYQLRKITLLYTARGCPHNCAFCAHRVMTYGERGVRLFPLERVLDEMEFLYRHYGINCLQILDDTFTVSKERIRLMIDGMRKRKILGKICFFNVFVRANIIDDEFSELLKELRVITVFMGVESGSKRMLKKLKDGPISPKIVESAVDSLGRSKVYVVASFMLFSPGETKVDFEKSIELAKLLAKKENLFSISSSVTTPYPGTKLWLEAIKSGVVDIKKPNWEDFIMLHLGNAKKMPRVFYRPNWVGGEEMNKQWQRFVGISNVARDRLEKISGLDETIVQLNKINDSTVAFLSMTERWKRLLSNPRRSLSRLINKPKIISLIFGDVKAMFLGK